MRKAAILTFISTFVFFALLTNFSGCKKWEGRYYIQSAVGQTVYYADTNESLFSIAIEIGNEEQVGVGAVFADWDFEICEDEELVLKVNRANYGDFQYVITLYAETPVPDSSSFYPGVLNLVSGREKDKWKVPGDIFNGKTPNKLKFSVMIVDDNGYTNVFSGERAITHSIL